MEGTKYNQLEIARIIGEPLDPRKPSADLVTLIAEQDTADPDEYVYYFDVLTESDRVITITGTGELTTVNVLPDTPAQFTFIDISSPEYYVKITDLASAKEATLARKLKTIDRSLNLYEINYMTNLAQAAAITSSHRHDLQAGRSRFSYDDLIFMIQDVIDYGDNYVLLVGAQIDQDIKLWNWNDNKYQSLTEAFQDLGLQKVRLNNSVTIDTSAASILGTNTAYIVATSTEIGKPFLFVRKKLNDIDLLGGAIKQNGEKPQRLVFVSPNPVVTAGSSGKRYLAVGLTGYEEIVAACTNPWAVSDFTRLNTIGGN